MIIDFHTHTFPDAFAAKTVAALSRVSRTKPFTDGTAAALRASMERAGVDHSVLLPVATKAAQVAGINNAAAELNSKGEGLISFGGIHPDFPDWSAELDRMVQLGLKGVKIHPVYQKAEQDDIRYLRILERAGELGLIVVTHTGIDIGYPDETQCSPEKLRSAIRQVGPVKIVAAHMGGWKQWDEALEQLADTDVFVDTSFSIGIMEPIPDSGYSSEELQLLTGEQFVAMVRAYGVHRVLFGTDSPWSGQQESLAWLRTAPLTATERTAILGENAQKLLGIS
ncbi:MAG: amidohydrolase [Oscillibacter sp.]|nr:amidohydrolase [Oscillibacter sp.]